MTNKDEQSMPVCDERGCYKLKDILQNPHNNCNSKECKELEEEFSKYMHLGIPIGYYHSTTMFIPDDNYQERSKNDPMFALVIDEKSYASLIEPSIDDMNEPKKSTKKITKKARKSSKKTTKKK
jgi:hypothetical protein